MKLLTQRVEGYSTWFVRLSACGLSLGLFSGAVGLHVEMNVPAASARLRSVTATSYGENTATFSTIFRSQILLAIPLERLTVG